MSRRPQLQNIALIRAIRYNRHKVKISQPNVFLFLFISLTLATIYGQSTPTNPLVPTSAPLPTASGVPQTGQNSPTTSAGSTNSPLPNVAVQESNPNSSTTNQQEPVELRLLRQQVQQQALLKSATLTEQYIKALAAIEQEASSKGDYEQALLAQQRRFALSQLQNLSLHSSAIILKPSEATRFVGVVSYDASTDSLFPWRGQGSSASWELTKITPGEYDVVLTYGVAPIGEYPARYNANYDPKTGGTFELFEDSNLPGASQNRRSAAVTSTGDWNTHITMQLQPPIHLTRSSARLTLRISRTNGDGGVMQLKEIRLTPASNLKNLSIDTPSDPVRSLQLTHQQKLKDLTTPIITTYLQSLQTLLTEAKTQQQNETVNELNAEIQRAQKWLDRPLAPGRNRTAIQLFENVEEEWNDVRYVDDPANRGDRFMVQHNGVKFSVGLKNVSCPPADPDAVGELQHYAAYFHIATEDALIIGKQAREFTATSLRNKPLKLLTNGQKDRDGRLRATVVLPYLGDFAGIMVDNGLAIINPPAKPRHPHHQTISTPISDHAYLALQQRESIARERPSPPGAWAYRDSGSHTPDRKSGKRANANASTSANP